MKRERGMGRYCYLRITLLAVTIILCSLQYLVRGSGSSGTPHDVSSSRFEKIQTLLKKLNKTPLLTILSPDGDIIDCIRRRKQLAFDHPLLKHHRIQRRPSVRPSRSEGDEAYVNGSQLWHQNGTTCPIGTVPVRRTTVDDVLRAPFIELFGKKRPPNRFSSPEATPSTGHEHAIADYTVVAENSSQGLYGTQVSINVWDPFVEEPSEFSLAQFWISSGTYNNSDLNTVEAGWQVYPARYNDTNPRLFVYWTKDAYNQTGCYNLGCPGFVQTSNVLSVGTAISSVSSTGNNTQFEIILLVFKDPKTGNWWLQFNGNPVGYWPAELFTSLSQYATTVQWGGEVFKVDDGGQHTTTQMGSGQFAEEGFGKASYFRGLQVVDSTNTLRSDVLGQGLVTEAEAPTCYDITSFYDANDTDWGYYFFYGGPGRNPNCP